MKFQYSTDCCGHTHEFNADGHVAAYNDTVAEDGFKDSHEASHPDAPWSRTYTLKQLVETA